MIHRLDRLLPGPRVGGRESPEAYSRWEYESGKALLSDYPDLRLSLAGGRVLDIGCGPGGKSVVYAEEGADVTGLDLEPSHAGAAAAFAGSRGCRLDVVTGDAALLPFADESFDLVIANDSMEHFADPEGTLNEISRVTRPGGRIFVFFTPWSSPLGSHLYDYIRTPWCHLVYSEGMLEKLLAIELEERGEPDPPAKAAGLIAAYREENNRIDIPRWRDILGRAEELEIVFERLRPPRFEFLAPLTRLPSIGRFVTGTVAALLCKKE